MIKTYSEDTRCAADAALGGPQELRLLIADDSSTVRQALLSLVAGTEIRVVAEATDGQQAFTLTMLHAPDVVLLDIRMPHCDGFTALARIKEARPETCVLMLSTYDNGAYPRCARSLGAAGYLAKGTGRDELLAAIRAAATGCQAPGPAPQ